MIISTCMVFWHTMTHTVESRTFTRKSRETHFPLTHHTSRRLGFLDRLHILSSPCIILRHLVNFKRPRQILSLSSQTHPTSKYGSTSRTSLILVFVGHPITRTCTLHKTVRATPRSSTESSTVSHTASHCSHPVPRGYSAGVRGAH